MLLTVIVGKYRDLLQAMASQAMQRLQHFNSQNISNTLWAFASLNHHPGPMLLKVLQRELVHKLRQFTPQGIENVLWAFATLGHHPGQSQGQTTCKLLSSCRHPPLSYSSYPASSFQTPRPLQCLKTIFWYSSAAQVCAACCT